jgi:hypothetical protein
MGGRAREWSAPQLGFARLARVLPHAVSRAPKMPHGVGGVGDGGVHTKDYSARGFVASVGARIWTARA